MFKSGKNKTSQTNLKAGGWAIGWDWAKSIVFAILMALLIKATVVEAYFIPTPSMEKTLMVGDFIVGNKFVYGIKIPFTNYRLPAFSQPQRGDLIVFNPPHNPHENYVKRCIGIPGDTIQLINKEIYINGVLLQDDKYTQYLSDQVIPGNQVLSDPYQEAYKDFGIRNDGYRPYAPFRDNSQKIIVPQGKYFMMGDNRDISLDSRMWGFVDRDNILGKALITLWSWKTEDKNAPVVDWHNPLTVAHNIGYNILHFPERMRWNRTLHIPH